MLADLSQRAAQDPVLGETLEQDVIQKGKKNSRKTVDTWNIIHIYFLYIDICEASQTKILPFLAWAFLDVFGNVGDTCQNSSKNLRWNISTSSEKSSYRKSSTVPMQCTVCHLYIENYRRTYRTWVGPPSGKLGLSAPIYGNKALSVVKPHLRSWSLGRACRILDTRSDGGEALIWSCAKWRPSKAPRTKPQSKVLGFKDEITSNDVHHQVLFVPKEGPKDDLKIWKALRLAVT